MKAPLWTVDAMAAATGAERAGPLPQAVSGISIDSRTVKDGEAFFAVKGDTHDGHDFVAAALKQGSALAVVARSRLGGGGGDAPLIVVDDVLEALRQLARAARLRSSAKIVAVTGSVGKTSTKEALALALAASGKTHASAASFNNHWGVPLSLARMAETAQYGVFEIGMNHAGEITPLVRLVRPHVAIITAVEPVHLEYFQSLEAIADAKAEIFLGLDPGGAAVICRDTPHHERLRRRAEEAGVSNIVSFGEQADAESRLLKCALHGDCSTVEALILGEPVTYKIGAPGRHLVIRSPCSRPSVSWALIWREPPSRLHSRRRRPAAAHGSTSNFPTAAPFSSTKATMPIRPPCGLRSRFWARLRSAPAAGASPSSATCLNWDRPARNSTATSSMRSASTASISSIAPAR
jgi:UDP-N-acetylmuramoyl-tripeptide--D-alanyl-D-alanine ligase